MKLMAFWDKNGNVIFCLAFLIVLLLVISFTHGFSLNVNPSGTQSVLNDEVSFTGELEIDSGEILPISYFELLISEDLCRFDVFGSPIAGCDEINITKISDGNFTSGNRSGTYNNISYDFGLGAGYGNDVGFEKLVFNFSFNSSFLGPGIFTTRLKSKILGETFSQDGGNISIINPISIGNYTVSDSCLLENEMFSVSSEINGSIMEVLIAVGSNGNFSNYSLGNHGEGIYIYNINKSLVNSGTLEWQFFVKDISGNFSYGPLQTMQVNNRTILEVIPGIPEGLNDWYLNEPLFILSAEPGANITYRWNGLYYNYTGPFGLEGTPNNDSTQGGIGVLRYWSDICDESLQEQNKTFKFDFTNPLITDLVPGNNSNVTSTKRPQIRALLDEIYQSNSEIDNGSIVMKVNGFVVAPLIVNQGLDREIKYSPPSNLPDGWNNVSINVSDNSGRNSELIWNFYVNLTNPLNLTIYSPLFDLSNTRRIMINLTTGSKADVSYINYNDNLPRERSLCRNCEEYGFLREKTLNLIEGNNNITIFARDEFGNLMEKNIIIYVDSKKPRISSTEPGRNQITNGSEFLVKYTEVDVQSVVLYWNPNVTFQNCSSGNNQICSRNVNLSDFDGTYINYYFEIRDRINNASSRITRVLVDTSSPILEINLPLNGSNLSRRVQFNITVSEESLLQYYDSSDSGARWKTLCNNCDEYGNTRKKLLNFKVGNHSLMIRAVDDAGNSDVVVKNFFVD